MSPEILTVGHSTHPAERFTRLLRAQGVELVADVRRFPSSRRNPQFNAGRLRESLAGAGIAYESLGSELGGRRAPGAGAGTSLADALRAYAEYARGPEFAAGLERLERLAHEHRTAIMCAEGDWRRCHRRLIADGLAARGWRVVHIAPDASTEEHDLTLL